MVLLQYYKDFATMSLAMSSLMSPARFSGDVSGEVDFATIAHFCCCEISGKVSGSEVSLFFFYFVDEPFFAIWSKTGLLFAV